MCFVKIILLQLLKYLSLSVVLCKNNNSNARVGTQWCSTVCDPMDCSPPDSSVYGIFQQEYWSGLPFPSSGDLPDPGMEPTSPALAGGFFTLYHLKKTNNRKGLKE